MYNINHIDQYAIINLGFDIVKFTWRSLAEGFFFSIFRHYDFRSNTLIKINI